MNELEKQIFDLISPWISSKEIAKEVSKFFLEEIKDAFDKGWMSRAVLPEEFDKELLDYLKSKYKI
jgi:hypothetical protein